MLKPPTPSFRAPRLNAARIVTFVLSLALVGALVATPRGDGVAAAAEDSPGSMFVDDNGSVHEADIEALALAGITQGCNPSGDRFCPDSTLTRAQAAAFFQRGLGLPATSTDFFVDDNGSIFEGNINAVAADGITRGCSNDGRRFCPDDTVTRAQFASFVVRALGLTDGAGSDRFADDNGSIHEADIERLAEAGITVGCASDRFCPDGRVTRAQAASFLVRALDLPPAPGWDGTTVAAPSGDWPTPDSTGPRIPTSQLQGSGSITTSYDGQVIEGLDVVGQIKVIHDNVVIRDTRVQYTANYGIYLPKKPDGTCTVGTVIEYVELDGSRVADHFAPAYDSGCEWSLNAVHLHNAGSAIRTYGNTVITNSYLVNDTYGPSDAHREAVLVRGSNHVIRNNVLICDVPQGGCSAALAVYGYPYPVSDVLVEGNWLAATAAFCAYGGGTHEYGDQATNVDYFNNAFSVSLTPDTDVCGRAGNITAHDAGVRGNERAGNFIYETGQIISS